MIEAHLERVNIALAQDADRTDRGRKAYPISLLSSLVMPVVDRRPKRHAVAERDQIIAKALRKTGLNTYEILKCVSQSRRA